MVLAAGGAVAGFRLQTRGHLAQQGAQLLQGVLALLALPAAGDGGGILGRVLGLGRFEAFSQVGDLGVLGVDGADDLSKVEHLDDVEDEVGEVSLGQPIVR